MARKFPYSKMRGLNRLMRGGRNGSIKPWLAAFSLGVSLGVGYEEFVGVGTWHQYKAPTDEINICFTPPAGCLDLIAQQIAMARESIYVQAYGLTAMPVINQLKYAHQRGVEVKILLDGGNLSDNAQILSDLKKYGLAVYLDKMPGIAHNKVMIIDKHKVITGSFNFTNAADRKNAENVLLLDDPLIADRYLRNWYKRYQSARSKTTSW